MESFAAEIPKPGEAIKRLTGTPQKPGEAIRHLAGENSNLENP